MKSCVISCPLDAYSGYGKRAYDLVRQIIVQYPDWDIKILSQRWGSTPMGYLQDSSEWDLLNRVIYRIEQKPDIWIQITIPCEFQPVGKFNIGVTAAMETTTSDISWVQGCNRMDLVLVSSVHGKASLLNSTWLNKKTQQKEVVTTPVEVLFEGIDLNKYCTVSKPSAYRSPVLENLENNWNYLVVGHWLPGNFGQDRKNIALTVKTFLETFKDQEKAPGLVLKVELSGNNSIPGKYKVLQRIEAIKASVRYTKSLPNIYLLYGILSDEEMCSVYNDGRIRAMISLAKGEGFGRPLAEFAAIGKPIICSGWSGPLDFLHKNYTYLLSGKLEHVDPSAASKNMILTEASWFSPDEKQAYTALYNVWDLKTREIWQKKAKQEADYVKTNFSVEKMGIECKKIIDAYLPEFTEYAYIQQMIQSN